MAGDWIKVEVATLQKAEVLRIAELLGISSRECVGLLCEFWAWLDANARTEFVPNLSRRSLDIVLHCQGLAACLEDVRWASWDEKGTTMHVVNYANHNGASAKTRAYEQRKKKNQRANVSPICPLDEGTREEKRRVSTSLRSVDNAALPDWLPPSVWQDWVAHRKARKGFTAKAQELCLRDLAKLRTKGHDPTAVIERSIANGWTGLFPLGVERQQTKQDKNAAVAEAMYGNLVRQMNDERNDIAGESTRVD